MLPNDGWMLGSAVIMIRILQRVHQNQGYRMLRLPGTRDVSESQRVHGEWPQRIEYPRSLSMQKRYRTLDQLLRISH